MKKWERIRKAVLEKVRDLPPGSRLPTVLDYRAEFKASQHSVCRALDSLEQDGLIVKKPRGGILVAEPPDTMVKSKRLAYVSWYGPSPENGTTRSHPFFQPLMHAISTAFENSDYESALYYFPSRGIVDSNSSLERDISNDMIRGLIVSSYHLTERDIPFLKQHGVDTVLIGADTWGSGFPTIEINSVKIGLLAAAAVARTKRHPVALITGRTVEAGEQAFLMSRESAGEPVDDCYRIHCPANFETTDQAITEGREAVDELLKLPGLPQAVWVTDDMAAMGVLQALHDADVHVPRDMAVVVSTSTACVFTHPVVRVAISPETAGKLAADTLFRIIEGQKLERRHLYVDPELLDAPEALASPAINSAV